MPHTNIIWMWKFMAYNPFFGVSSLLPDRLSLNSPPLSCIRLVWLCSHNPLSLISVLCICSWQTIKTNSKYCHYLFIFLSHFIKLSPSGQVKDDEKLMLWYYEPHVSLIVYRPSLTSHHISFPSSFPSPTSLLPSIKRHLFTAVGVALRNPSDVPPELCEEKKMINSLVAPAV